MSDDEINRAMAEQCDGFTWMPTGYTTDMPPRPRWMTLCKDGNLPYGWQAFPGKSVPTLHSRHQHGIPDYLHDANAVIPLLGKDWDCRIRNDTFCRVIIYRPSEQWEGTADTFCRAACMALLAAHKERKT